MGCGASTIINRHSCRSPDLSENEDTNSFSLTTQWKVLPSVDEARVKFISDGTIAESMNNDHIEFRSVLDIAIATEFFLVFLTK